MPNTHKFRRSRQASYYIYREYVNMMTILQWQRTWMPITGASNGRTATLWHFVEINSAIIDLKIERDWYESQRH
jgi:hypothetical protein